MRERLRNIKQPRLEECSPYQRYVVYSVRQQNTQGIKVHKTSLKAVSDPMMNSSPVNVPSVLQFIALFFYLEFISFVYDPVFVCVGPPYSFLSTSLNDKLSLTHVQPRLGGWKLGKVLIVMM